MNYNTIAKIIIKGVFNMPKFPILKEGFVYIFALLFLTLLVYFFNPYISIIFLVLTLFVMFFFRNPNRKIQRDNNTILSPADGVVMEVSEANESSYIGTNSIKISIFLSLFNVHANKSPIDGVVEYINYRPGKYIPAFKSHASEINEKNTIGIKGENIKILVSQITGFVARRIVCWVKEGDSVSQGINYGLIKFGSCTEIIVPSNVRVLVKPGEKVKGGISIIGVINNEI